MEKIITKGNGVVFLFFFVFAFLLFYKLEANYLTHWDEAWHADVSRNVAKGGDLIKLQWNGESFFDKPPLYFWLSALSMKLFGFTEFAARLPSGVAAFGLGITLCFLAKLLFNKTTVMLTLLVISSTVGFLFRARSGNLDTLLALCIFLSIFLFYKAYQSRSSRLFFIMGTSLGFGFLTKGVIVFLFLLICFFYLLIRKEYSLLKPQFFLGSIIVGTAISLTWFLLSYFSSGQGFIEGFMANQFGKISTSSSFWSNFSFEYIWHLKSGLKLWFAPFIASVFYSFFQWRNSSRIIIAVYFLSLFIILSFSENKSNWFLIPLYPVTALMIAYSIDDIGRRFLKKTSVLIAIFLLVALLQIFMYRNDYIVPDIAGDEARVAISSKSLTEKDDILYLTNYYYPTTVYYSERKTYAVYSEHEENSAWWVKPKTAWKDILKNRNVFIITTNEEFEVLKLSYPDYTFTVLYESGEKKLVKRI